MIGRNRRGLWEGIIQREVELMKNMRNYKEVIPPKDH